MRSSEQIVIVQTRPVEVKPFSRAAAPTTSDPNSAAAAASAQRDDAGLVSRLPYLCPVGSGDVTRRSQNADAELHLLSPGRVIVAASPRARRFASAPR